jgi:hypothetical protein
MLKTSLAGRRATEVYVAERLAINGRFLFGSICDVYLDVCKGLVRGQTMQEIGVKLVLADPS